jgi:hypothetical protein
MPFVCAANERRLRSGLLDHQTYRPTALNQAGGRLNMRFTT